MELADKVVVVTGAGHGIGQALCQRFGREGLAGLVASDVDAESAATTAGSAGGIAVQADVGVERDVQRLVRTAWETFGRIDLFCSNAGVGGDGGVEADDEVWRHCWQVNVMGHVYAARAVIPRMAEQGGGYLLQTVSAAALLTGPGATPYTASKHAALALAESLAIDHAKDGITVSALCPGAVNTRLLMENIDAPTRAALLSVTRLVEPEDVAAAAVAGIQEERFLILSHPETAEQFRNRAHDPDRWLRGVRRALNADHR